MMKGHVLAILGMTKRILIGGLRTVRKWLMNIHDSMMRLDMFFVMGGMLILLNLLRRMFLRGRFLEMMMRLIFVIRGSAGPETPHKANRFQQGNALVRNHGCLVSRLLRRLHFACVQLPLHAHPMTERFASIMFIDFGTHVMEFLVILLQEHIHVLPGRIKGIPHKARIFEILQPCLVHGSFALPHAIDPPTQMKASFTIDIVLGYQGVSMFQFELLQQVNLHIPGQHLEATPHKVEAFQILQLGLVQKV
mmetsp:Transcript_27073/g.56712  ORF Transcript_27073/g.56712 Transcript_27073/m.56712 type:complete len:250 (-) Transcript_27073:177-926(-)